MKLFVTGATGFIGHHFARMLKAEGHEVRALVRPVSPEVEVARLKEMGAEEVGGDLADREALRRGCEGVDAVVHCAALVGITDREETFWEVNVQGTLNVLEAAAAAGVQRVVYLSTGGVLGRIRVPRAGHMTALAPENHYARSKAESERLGWAASARLGVPLAIVRPPCTYGPDDRRTLPLFQAVARRQPLPWRTDVPAHPVHVSDFCRGLLACVEGFPGSAGRTYHLAGPTPVPMRDFIGWIAEAIGVRPPPHLPLRVVEPAAAACDAVGAATGLVLPLTRRRLMFFTYPQAFAIEEAKEAFGYDPQVDLREGLVETVAWYRANGLL